MGPMVWVNGDLIRLEDARVPVTDHSFLAGDGAFETIAIRDGIPLALTRHLARLRQSLSGLGLPFPAPDRSIREALEALVEVNALRDGFVRLMVSGEGGPFSSTRQAGTPRMVMGSAMQSPDDTEVRVVTVPWTRNERGVLTGLKTTSYAENVVALAHANAFGAREAIFPNTRGELCEGTGSNIFLVLNSELVTPPLSSGCLPGITRELVISVSEATQRRVPMDEVHRTSEAFLTSSTRGVLPIRRIDGLELPLGPFTRAARDAYDDLIQANPDP